MFDYKLLGALAAVVEQGGFERAAQVLGLSQSAVSQRIKLLEARVGQPVLLRSSPPSATEVGQRLLNHVQQVRLLEHDVQAQVPGLNDGSRPERLRIALNADSLATWWAAATGDFCRQTGMLLELVVEDQDVALKRMRLGDVAACLCAEQQPMAGSRSLCLGAMRYLALASPDFMARHLPNGFNGADLIKAPAVVFGPDDQFQHRYLSSLGYNGAFNYHLCPSSEGFMQLVQAGFGWGMLPEAQAREALARGLLCELKPNHPVDVALYWHHWRNGSALMEQLTRQLIQHARHALLPVASVRERRR